MAALSDTQLPIYFNGRYYRVCATIVSPSHPPRPVHGILSCPRGQESAISVVCSVPLPTLGRRFIEIPMSDNDAGKKNQTAVRWYGGMEGLTLVKLIGFFFRREMTRRKKVKRVGLTRRNPSWTIAASYRLVFTIVRSKFSSKLGITQ